MSTPKTNISDAIARKIIEVDRAIEQLQAQKVEIHSKKNTAVVSYTDSRECIRVYLASANKAIQNFTAQLESLTDTDERAKCQALIDENTEKAKDLGYIVSSWESVAKIETEIKDWERFRETLVKFSNITQHTLVFKSYNGELIFSWPVYSGPMPDSCRKVLDDAGTVMSAVNKELTASEFIVVISRNMSGKELDSVREKTLARIKVLNEQVSRLEEAFQKLVDFDFEKEIFDSANKINDVIKANFISLRDKILATGQISEATANRTANMELAKGALELRASIPDYEAITAVEMQAESVIIDSLQTLNAVLQKEIDLFARV